MTNLTKNFTKEELLYSATGTSMGIINMIPDTLIPNLQRTAEWLQELRNILGEKRDVETPIKVLSCFRSERLNKAVGGAKASDHMKALAADIQVDGMTPLQLAQFIKKSMPFDKLINEFNQWVHVSIPATDEPKSKLMTAVKEKGTTVYKPGLF